MNTHNTYKANFTVPSRVPGIRKPFHTELHTLEGRAIPQRRHGRGSVSMNLNSGGLEAKW